MRQAQAFSGIVIGGAVALLATQPSLAATTQVTAVRLDNSGGELQLTLETKETKAGAERPQVFTVSRGNDLVADLVNTQLSLNKGDSFRQADPMPGISSVVVSQPDANSVRVTVSGTSSPPTSQVLQSNQDLITLGISTQATPQAEDSNPVTSSPNAPVLPGTLDVPSLQAAKAEASPATIPTPVSQTPISQPLGEAPNQAEPTSVAQKLIARQVEQAPTPATPTSIAQTTVPQPVVPVQAPVAPAPAPQSPVQAPAPDVLIPNPQITIDGFPVQPAGPAGTVQPVAPAPPLLPRAIAPPVGDIAISNISAAASLIDLGTGVRVPRLVLREAPVREVLALLARSAGLNLAFTGGSAGAQAGQSGQPGQAGSAELTISLDIENESVQDVFNYVLQLSGFQANRVGRTIFVGNQLPLGARNVVSRTLRLNQVSASAAANYLTTQGAETQIPIEQVQIQTIGEGAAARTVEIRTPTIQSLRATQTDGTLLLRGLSVSVDERLNTVTLVGEPRHLEIATMLLTQLDLRRRQVAVNVKIVDVNLSGTDAFNASFSFGIGDSFFVNDGGAASFNYGPSRPPTNAQVGNSLANPTVIVNPYGPDGDTPGNSFLDFGSSSNVPLTGIGNRTITIDNTTGQVSVINDPPPNSLPPQSFLNRIAGASGNPFQAGITDFTLGTPNVTTTTISPGSPGQVVTLPNGTTQVIGATGPTTTSSFTPGTLGSVTTALPSLFQFPKRLLAALQAQITSGNAKIITDPTLVVQEGQRAIVNLTQEVYGGQRGTGIGQFEPIIKNAGLTLDIQVTRIDDNGFVSLSVNPTVSSPGTSIANTGGQGEITLLQERRLQSGQIRLRDGQTLILSGIIQESDRTTVSKLPILGDIPILGALFRRTNRQNQRQEVIVLLTPQIIDDSQGSSFGYSYTPGRETRQLLQERGVSP